MISNETNSKSVNKQPRFEPKILKEALKMSNIKKSVWFNLGIVYNHLGLYDKSI